VVPALLGQAEDFAKHQLKPIHRRAELPWVDLADVQAFDFMN
jgi:hypothetical protein